MKLANIKTARHCAFCKHWYDPTNSAIEPQNAIVGLWRFNPSMKKKCLRTNLDKAAWTSCGKFECKV